jgi:hypothetical protein
VKERAMSLDLSAEEHDLLVDLLDRAYRDLKEEIYKTEAYAYKKDLKSRERMLVGLIQRLEQRTPA